MKRKLLLRGLLLILIALFTITSPKWAEAATIQITQNNDPDRQIIHPVIDDTGHVAWQQDNLIYLYDQAYGIRQIGYGVYDPMIEDGVVVWPDYSGQVCYYDANSESLGSVPNTSGDNRIAVVNAVYGNYQIAWEGYESSNGMIYYYNGSDTLTVSDSEYNNHSPFMNNQGQIAWLGNNQNSQFYIFLKEGSNIKTVDVSDYPYYSLDLNNSGHIVMSNDCFNNNVMSTQIKFYDGVNTKIIRDNVSYQCSPVIDDNDHIAWMEKVGEDWEIFYCADPAADTPIITQITDNAYDDMCPKLCDGKLIWMEYDGQNWKIFSCNDPGIDAPVQITNDKFSGHTL